MTVLAGATTPGLRRREVTWDDPLVGAALARQMSGLDYLPSGFAVWHAATAAWLRGSLAQLRVQRISVSILVAA